MRFEDAAVPPGAPNDTLVAWLYGENALYSGTDAKVLVMFTPGAPKCTLRRPKCVKTYVWSLWSVAATDSTLGRSKLAG